MDASECFNPRLFEGEVAVVTGGGSGLGLAIATGLVACGAEVVITGRSVERLESAEASVAARTGRLVSSFPCDVRQVAEVDRLRDFVATRHGGAGIVVNNAAANFVMPAEKMGHRAFDAVVQTDLYGTFNITQAFVPEMIERGRGNILNITLPYAERGFPGFAHCGAAKAGIISLTATWAYEWGRYGIRVNAVAPGPVPTQGVAVNMLGTDAPFASSEKDVPLQRLGRPDDICGAALFLLSPASSWITGCNLVVDGGLYLNRSPADGT